MPPISYIDHVVTQAQSSPSMKSLERFIRRKAAHSSRIAIIDYAQDGALRCNNKPKVLENCDIDDLTKQPATDTMRLLLIEDISPQAMIVLGEACDINPNFFAGYVNLHISDKTKKGHASQSFMALESGEECLHLPYQQILDLRGTKLRRDIKDVLQTDSNISRGIEHLASLSGRHLGLAYATCSIMVKRFATYSICLILVDPLVTSAFETTRAGSRQRCYAKSLEADFKESELRRSMTSFKNNQTLLDGKSMLDNLLHSFQGATFPRDSAATSVFSDLCRYPIFTLIAHWNIYLRLVERISQHYKHSLEVTEAQLDDRHLIDLICWRRQISQTHRRVTILSEFVGSRIEQGYDSTTWQLLFSDIAKLQDQLQDYARLFEGMIILTESMVQNLDPRRSIFNDIYAAPVFYITILFVPMTFFTSLFKLRENNVLQRTSALPKRRFSQWYRNRAAPAIVPPIAPASLAYRTDSSNLGTFSVDRVKAEDSNSSLFGNPGSG
ncbi:hypothetical protein FGADI_1921 [Fusarium gaditjirri]|uniref:Uncharacterized protein n=1 Tax=Fusarium gaditjirri TaxID=282569 RepID=A0A8H4X1V8_9HYPO|nr:hypothetical protein FGADI_1921 [Fusarium gaditjirri]